MNGDIAEQVLRGIAGRAVEGTQCPVGDGNAGHQDLFIRSCIESQILEVRRWIGALAGIFWGGGGAPRLPGVGDAALLHRVRERIDIGDAVENGFFAAAVGGDNGFAEAIKAELEQALENYVDGRGNGKLDVEALDDFEGLCGIGGTVGWRIFQGADAFEQDEFAVIFFDIFRDGSHLFIEVG